jgi:hypothetical protein
MKRDVSCAACGDLEKCSEIVYGYPGYHISFARNHRVP